MLGVLLGPRSELTNFRYAGLAAPQLIWRWVVTVAYKKKIDPDTHVVAPTVCGELEQNSSRSDLKATACICKAGWWFGYAVRNFLSVPFIGKVEDDTIVHAGRLVHELLAVSQLSPLIWFGMFQWCAHNRADGTGAWCGESSFRWGGRGRGRGFSRCKSNWKEGLVYPFASGGLDIRSRGFVARTKRCLLISRTEEATSHGSCDGGLGKLTWDACGEGLDPMIVDVTWRKWVYPFRALERLRNATTMAALKDHVTVMHPNKNYREHVDWNVSSPALGPLVMKARRVDAGNRSVVEWEPMNSSVVKTFEQFFVINNEKNRYPCVEAPEICHRRRRRVR